MIISKDISLIEQSPVPNSETYKKFKSLQSRLLKIESFKN
jgi:hypothetical protein